MKHWTAVRKTEMHLTLEDILLEKQDQKLNRKPSITNCKSIEQIGPSILVHRIDKYYYPGEPHSLDAFLSILERNHSQEVEMYGLSSHHLSQVST